MLPSQAQLLCLDVHRCMFYFLLDSNRMHILLHGAAEASHVYPSMCAASQRGRGRVAGTSTVWIQWLLLQPTVSRRAEEGDGSRIGVNSQTALIAMQKSVHQRCLWDHRRGFNRPVKALKPCCCGSESFLVNQHLSDPYV